MRLVIWAWNTCLISCMTGSSGLEWLPRQRSTSGSVTHILLSKPGSQILPLKTMWPHILCSWSTFTICAWNLGRGLDQNVLVVTGHFTRYAQAYVTRTQTTQMTAKTLWDMFIVHYGLPNKILMDKDEILRVSWWLTSVS